MTENKTCETCVFYAKDGFCANVESEKALEFTTKEDGCKEWEGKGERT